mmetsp:Transcript_10717/g.27821  ORF Transcript_10717/g.27821 Transcript_10717/m.27821 type:complete len:99 (-) Transcript_10717:3636-3932(-)
MMQSATFAKRHANHVALGFFCGFADRFRHFAGFTLAEPCAALLVTNDNQGCKTEILTAFDRLRDAVDTNQLVDDVGLLLVAIAIPAASSSFFSHRASP